MPELGGIVTALIPALLKILAMSIDLGPALGEPSGEVIFQQESDRVINVVVKLARGHAIYELSEQIFERPTHVMAVPLHTLTAAALEHFETPPQPVTWPEIGTRAMQRMVQVTSEGALVGNSWIEVQEGQYRYVTISEGPVMVRMVIGEYLACEVIWQVN